MAIGATIPVASFNHFPLAVREPQMGRRLHHQPMASGLVRFKLNVWDGRFSEYINQASLMAWSYLVTGYWKRFRGYSFGVWFALLSSYLFSRQFPQSVVFEPFSVLLGHMTASAERCCAWLSRPVHESGSQASGLA
jgi:hypothetical protein